MQGTKDGRDRSQYPRFEIPIQMRPTEILGKESRIKNISMGGVRIFGTKKVDVGTTLKIDFALPGSEWIIAKVQVVWAKERPSQPILKYDFGCRFIEVDSESQKILLEHLAMISSLKIEV